MTSQHVMNELLKSDSKYLKNQQLLKKILITTNLGRLQVNGLSPDRRISLTDYLLDNERVMFDYTRLSEENKEIFQKWLLEPHQNEKKQDYFSAVHTNEYRGFTAEVALSFWGRILNWFENRCSESWKIHDLNISLDHQVTNIEICEGKHGSLIGFNQYLAPDSGRKYSDHEETQNESIGNTKRVFITDALVKQLVTMDLEAVDFKSITAKPHPYSIEVNNYKARYNDMHNYRRMQKYLEEEPWYIRLWKWIMSFFMEDKKIESKITNKNQLTELFENENVTIFERSETQDILVREKRPDISHVVFCGGGAKIFGHIGVSKALREAHIDPEHFAGASAGAIMSLLCYLGYNDREMLELFKPLKQEHLIFLKIDRRGLSDPHALKALIDYAIVLKIKEIVTKYNEPFPKGKITFSTLENLRKKYPDCGIKKELVVTATRIKSGTTRYFSLKHSPNLEVSEAVKISASFPVVFRATTLDGEEYNDGGILSNLPTEAFADDHSTFLESEFANNFKLLAVQFDNGNERTAIDKLEQVYRDNFIVNWFFSVLTGVKDPASGGERDLLKLRKYAAQSVVLNIAGVSTTSDTSEALRAKIIKNGYEATNDYLNLRYEKRADGTYENQEYMYSTFNSLDELLSYCCYRNDKKWFKLVLDLIHKSSLPNKNDILSHAAELEAIYFQDTAERIKTPGEPKPVTFFGNEVVSKSSDVDYSDPFLAIYPVFLKISSEYVKNDEDKTILMMGRHALSLENPFACLVPLDTITHKKNIILHLFVTFIKELEKNPEPKFYQAFQDLHQLLNSDVNFLKDTNFGLWKLSTPQCMIVLKLLMDKQYILAENYMQKHSEPKFTTVVNNVCDKTASEENPTNYKSSP